MTIDWGDIDLGKYNSPESWRQYAEVIADWTAGHAADEIAAGPRSNTNASDIFHVAVSFCAWLSRN
ncbi:hypothetical protein [Symmachiella dynata]|uniref:hypothetical protein n=1 Tax=Symmachiella dynata TaxID=2527995 RepID=UPI0018D41D6A|nr:hypothetical protein [Symmachiella dynata]